MKLSEAVLIELQTHGPLKSSQIIPSEQSVVPSQRSIVMALFYLEAMGKVKRSSHKRGAAAIWSIK